MIRFRPFPGVRGGFLGADPSGLRSEGVAFSDFFQVCQVHGAELFHLVLQEPGPPLSQQAADAIVTTLPGVAIAVRTADCVPILMAHPSGTLAAVHAGWRGSAAEILPRTLSYLQGGLGLEMKKLQVSIGPAICQTCYEVGPELAEHFAAFSAKGLWRPGKPGKFHLDLKQVNYLQALEFGLMAGQIELRPECTRCLSPAYYSLRAANAEGRSSAGRNYSWIKRLA